MAFASRIHDFSHLSEAQLAWAAGFLDGEGCITFITQKCWGKTPMLMINIINTNIEVVQMFKEWFQCGSTTIQKQSNPNWKDKCMWTCKAKAAEDVLRALQPHVRVKHKQLALALKLRENSHISLEEKQQIVAELRSFNGRRSVYNKKGAV